MAKAPATVTNMTAKTGLELLDDVLAIYGGDRARWPAAARSELSGLIASSAEARAMMAEAEALDLLMDLAPKVSGDRLALLSERIAAQAERTPRMSVIPGANQRRAKPAPEWRRHATGITALAASLVLGLMIGQNATLAPAVSEIATAVGIESLGDGSQIAAADEAYIDVGIDEDLL